jgi:hypothetical protein
MATIIRPVPGRPDFWKESKRRTVTWDRDDKRLNALIAETNFADVYALVSGKRVLKVGEAEANVGARLWKHLTSPGRDRPDWEEFSRALRGRTLTIHFLPYDGPGDIHRLIEIAAMNTRRPLWEEMKGREALLKPREMVSPGAVARRIAKELGWAA